MFKSTSRPPAMKTKKKKTTSQSENEYIFMLEKHVFGTLDLRAFEAAENRSEIFQNSSDLF